MTYPFEGIQINGRGVSLSAILNSTATPRTDFEKSTFDFIHDWLGSKNEFEFQTSGSTGEPKQVSFTRKQIQSSAIRTADVLGMKEGDTVCVCVNTSFVAGKMMLVRAFARNLKIIAVEPSSNPLENIADRVDFISLVPMQIQELINRSSRQLNDMKGILVGGASVSSSLLKSIHTMTVPVFAAYGMTETISNIALQRLSGDKKQDSFQPLRGVTVHLDNRGCLIVDDNETDIHVTTNDLAEVRTDQSFIINGRVDNVINSGGVKISPEVVEMKIETVLKTLNIPNPFIISSVNDEKLGERIVLLIEGSVDLQAQELVSTQLRHYERPKEVICLEKFAYTSTGKVHRQKTAQLITKSRG